MRINKDEGMSEAWQRLITDMLRHMIREFLTRPGELLTFRRLAYLVRSDVDILHAIAEHRTDLFLITSDHRFIKLFTEAVERIVDIGIDQTISEVGPSRQKSLQNRDHRMCPHFGSESEILADLGRCSFDPDTLARDCCWRELCRVRSGNPGTIDRETWSEICRIRGYLRMRQNPRGF